MTNKVVVLIPHYNDVDGLYRAIASFSADEFCDVLVIDDGSSLLFEEVKASNFFIAQGDVNFLYLEQNKGIETALNTGLAWAKKQGYALIARLDCGDLNLPRRIKKQVDFLEQHPKVQLVGTWAEAIDPQGGSLYQLHLPVEHEEIKKKMFLNNVFIHPTVMFRANALEVVKEYPYDYPAAEDYAFFFKFVENFQTANIPEVLVKFEINMNGGISSTNRRRQLNSRIRLILEHFEFGYYPMAGITRAFLLLFIPRKFVETIKRKINWRGK